VPVPKAGDAIYSLIALNISSDATCSQTLERDRTRATMRKNDEIEVDLGTNAERNHMQHAVLRCPSQRHGAGAAQLISTKLQ
jgi:hypothetical protein